VWLTLVGHPDPTTWSSGVLAVVIKNGRPPRIYSVDYGNGATCNGTAIDCPDIANLWRQRTRR